MTVAFRPAGDDLAIIADLTTRVLQAVGLVMVIPALLSLVSGSTDDAAAFVVCASVAVILRSAVVRSVGHRLAEIRWIHGMVGSGLTWLAVPLLGALPLHLSGHFPDFLDAYFDAMSAVTTAGLSVINDLDHLGYGMNLWRHMMQFIGGQGLVLLTLTFFASGGGAVGMYAGEAREDKILPNVRRTAQFIWRASLVYFVLGASLLTVVLTQDGMHPARALFHAVNLFFAAFDTGGFSPTSASIGYYHSWLVESVLCVLMVAGALSFTVHYAIWNGRGRELVRNVETRVLAVTMTTTLALVLFGLATESGYTGFASLLRRGLFQAISAHSGAGFATVPGGLFSTAWGQLAPVALVLAMGIGGMSGSTTGGIKAIRIALAAKAVRQIVRGTVLPPDAVQVSTYHHVHPRRVDGSVLRAALMVLLLFLVLYLAGTAAGLFYGYELGDALFESTSAAAGVGLSVGITSPSMEAGLQLTYVVQMWIGRLEFVSGLALLGFVGAMLRGRV